MGDYLLSRTGAEINDFISMKEAGNILNVNSSLTNVKGIFLTAENPSLNIYSSEGYAGGLMAKNLYLGEGYGNYQSDYRFHCDGPALINGDVRTSGTRLTLGYDSDPYISGLLASYNSDLGSITGTIKITLPVLSGACVMQMMEVWVYNYNAQAGSQLIISGYTYEDGHWYNYHCRTSGAYSNGCRVASDGTNMCVLLGTTSTVWNYPKVFMTQYMAGYSDKAHIYRAKPTISIITSETGYYITGTAT